MATSALASPYASGAGGGCPALPTRRKIDDILHRLKTTFNVRVHFESRRASESLPMMRRRMASAPCMLLFISQSYIDSIKNLKEMSFCAIELLLCCLEKKPIVPVLVEQCGSPATWGSPILSSIFSSSPFVDCSGGIFEDSIENIYELVLDLEEHSFDAVWSTLATAFSSIHLDLPASLSKDVVLDFFEKHKEFLSKNLHTSAPRQLVSVPKNIVATLFAKFDFAAKVSLPPIAVQPTAHVPAQQQSGATVNVPDPEIHIISQHTPSEITFAPAAHGHPEIALAEPTISACLEPPSYEEISPAAATLSSSGPSPRKILEAALPALEQTYDVLFLQHVFSTTLPAAAVPLVNIATLNRCSPSHIALLELPPALARVFSSKYGDRLNPLLLRIAPEVRVLAAALLCVAPTPTHPEDLEDSVVQQALGMSYRDAAFILIATDQPGPRAIGCWALGRNMAASEQVAVEGETMGRRQVLLEALRADSTFSLAMVDAANCVSPAESLQLAQGLLSKSQLYTLAISLDPLCAAAYSNLATTLSPFDVVRLSPTLPGTPLPELYLSQRQLFVMACALDPACANAFFNLAVSLSPSETVELPLSLEDLSAKQVPSSCQPEPGPKASASHTTGPSLPTQLPTAPLASTSEPQEQAEPSSPLIAPELAMVFALPLPSAAAPALAPALNPAPAPIPAHLSVVSPRAPALARSQSPAMDSYPTYGMSPPLNRIQLVLHFLQQNTLKRDCGGLLFLGDLLTPADVVAMDGKCLDLCDVYLEALVCDPTNTAAYTNFRKALGVLRPRMAGPVQTAAQVAGRVGKSQHWYSLLAREMSTHKVTSVCVGDRELSVGAVLAMALACDSTLAAPYISLAQHLQRCGEDSMHVPFTFGPREMTCRQLWERAVDLDPKNSIALCGLALCLSPSGETFRFCDGLMYDRRRFLQKALFYDAANASALLSLAQCMAYNETFMIGGTSYNKLQLLTRSIASDPTQPDAYLALAATVSGTLTARLLDGRLLCRKDLLAEAASVAPECARVYEQLFLCMEATQTAAVRQEGILKVLSKQEVILLAANLLPDSGLVWQALWESMNAPGALQRTVVVGHRVLTRHEVIATLHRILPRHPAVLLQVAEELRLGCGPLLSLVAGPDTLFLTERRILAEVLAAGPSLIAYARLVELLGPDETIEVDGRSLSRLHCLASVVELDSGSGEAYLQFATALAAEGRESIRLDGMGQSWSQRGLYVQACARLPLSAPAWSGLADCLRIRGPARVPAALSCATAVEQALAFYDSDRALYDQVEAIDGITDALVPTLVALLIEPSHVPSLFTFSRLVGPSQAAALPGGPLSALSAMLRVLNSDANCGLAWAGLAETVGVGEVVCVQGKPYGPAELRAKATALGAQGGAGQGPTAPRDKPRRPSAVSKPAPLPPTTDPHSYAPGPAPGPAPAPAPTPAADLPAAGAAAATVEPWAAAVTGTATSRLHRTASKSRFRDKNCNVS